MAMDGDVLAQIDELAVRSSRSASPKSSDTPPRFALRAKSLQLRTLMTVSDVENGARLWSSAKQRDDTTREEEYSG